MVFQRVARSLKQQAWSSLFLELLVVVFGILIALQVDNWNEHRKRVAEAQEWRTHILVDLQASRSELQGRVDYFQAALRFGENALVKLQSNRPLSADEAWDVVLGAFQAGQIWPYQLTGPSYREAQNAGGMGLVGDETLLTALAELYDVIAHDFELVTGGLPKYREMIRERMAWPIQEHIWDADCQETIGTPGDTGYGHILVRCKPPPFDDLLQQSVAELRADKVIQQALVGRLSQLKVSISSTLRSIERVDFLVEMMNERP